MNDNKKRTELYLTYGLKAPSEACNIYLRVEAIITLTRSQTGQGTVTGVDVQHLETTTKQVTIDVTIPSSLIMCINHAAESEWITDPTTSYPLKT